MATIFASRSRPTQIRYTVENACFEFMSSGSHNQVADWAGSFRTYGDGDIQHSPTGAVRSGDFEDYLASLAIAIKEGKLGRLALDRLASHWPNPDNDTRIVWLEKLRYKHGVKTYYNYAERKVSKVADKRNDRRWKEVPTWADGSVEAICKLLAENEALNSSGLVYRYAAYENVRDAVCRLYNSYGWGDPTHAYFKVSNLADQAFKVVNCYVEAHRALQRAESGLDCYLHNRANEDEREAKAIDALGATACST